MKKIWQKSLASMVSAALCLTAFVGCLTVNAATTYEGTIASEGTTVEATATEATVDLVVSATVPEGAKGMACAGLKVTSGYGKLTNAVVTTDGAYVATKTDPVTGESTNIPEIGADGQFIVWANDTAAGVSSFTVSLTFNKAESVTAGTTYPVKVEYLGSKDIGAADWDENTFTFTTTGVAGITVHAHNVVYTSNKNGTHTSSCNAANCPGFTPEVGKCIDEDGNLRCDLCNYDMKPVQVTYDVTPNIYAGASRLVEPWGIKYSARYTGADIDKIATYGIAMVLKVDYIDSYATNPAEMVSSENAYIFTGEDLTYLGLKDGLYPQYSALLTQGIKTQNMGDAIYVCPYAIMNDGTYVYGTVKNNNMAKILNTNLGKDTVSSEEKAVCSDMLQLYNDALAHFEGKDMESLTANDVISARGSSCVASSSWSQITDSSTRVANISAGATRLIEPWGIKYTSKFYDSRATGTIVDRGVVILNELDFDDSYLQNPEAMRLNANSYVFTAGAETLKFVSNNTDGSVSYAALLTEDVYVYNIPSKFYVVPYVVLEDGSYIYGEVKNNSMNNIITTNSNKANVSDTEKAVGADMQRLYSSVCAYYDVVGWPSFIRK